MTAVAPPPFLQQGSRLGWTSNGNGNGTFASLPPNDAGGSGSSIMVSPGPRKPMQRQNSASSTTSTASTSSTGTTINGSLMQSNEAFIPPVDPRAYAAHNNNNTKKRPSRWPAGKAEPATGLSTARPQTVNSMTSGPSASSAISALHVPVGTTTVSGQLGHGHAQQPNGLIAGGGGGGAGSSSSAAGSGAEPQPMLHLSSMNDTFQRKSITVPYYPEVLRIGRQTNTKTVPTPMNGYFDSKVLSRSHAEVWADRGGRIFIRDVKSSNGTFVNGLRLSQENKESDPRELREQDVLELGIDIVSEDQKTVVHHKVAAKVEHAGVYGQAQDVLNFGDLDPSVGAGMYVPVAPQLKRAGSQGSIHSRVMNMATGQVGPMAGQPQSQQPAHLRAWLNPITTESIVKRINTEMKLAMQQSEDLLRARQTIDAMLNGKFESTSTSSPTKDPATNNNKGSSERLKLSSSKSKTNLETHFSDPPAPPPSAPLPEKPDVARALADPVIQPILRRNDTILPNSNTSSPTRIDHSSDILRLCEELKLAKGELSSQSERMKILENELVLERTARESAEERAQRLEQTDRRDSPRDSYSGDGQYERNDEKDRENADAAAASPPTPSDLQAQVDRLHATMDEMKQHMENFRQRAEGAEAERDEVRQSLAEMIEQKRRELSDQQQQHIDSDSAKRRTPPAGTSNGKTSPSSLSSSRETAAASSGPNGHILPPSTTPSSPTSESLLERAGVEEGQPITPEQAKMLTRFLTREVLNNNASGDIEEEGVSRTTYYGVPITSAAAVILLGVVLMGWGNGWPRVDG